MTMPALQKPHAKSKTGEHITCLCRRLVLWERGDIEELLREGKVIQRQLPTSSSRGHADKDTAHKFSNLIMNGKVRNALRLLTPNSNSGFLSLDQVTAGGQSVKDILQEKHPDANPAHPEVLLNGTNSIQDNNFHPILFDSITADVIRTSALHTEGSAGPSGVDAMSWRRFCTAFGQKSNDLCSALAAFARRISTTFVDPSSLQAYTACRLIPLDKCPGVRPIGIGEVARRIIGKAVMKTVKKDLQDAVGSLQLCAGQDAGCEAAVHAMSCMFEEDNTEAMLFVDASNAFNRLNRQVTLHNTQYICPAMGPILINTYRNASWLFVGGQCMLSKEGTTQGDPLAMAMYAIGTQPLIHRLNGIGKQVWYADDSAAGSSVDNLKIWWDLLEEIGPLYGYFPNGSKTHLLVKPDAVERARVLFKGTGINISTEGKRYLGGVIGGTPFLKQFVGRKVQEWANELSTFAKTQPHAAYAAFTHGLSSKWTYSCDLHAWRTQNFATS